VRTFKVERELVVEEGERETVYILVHRSSWMVQARRESQRTAGKLGVETD
jgi:hypothetical protein